MSNEIQRFTLYVYREAADMEPDESGEWVRYGDVADLLSRTQSPDVEGWRPIETAPRDRRILAVVEGDTRVVMWGKTSHVPLYGWNLADQGPEDFDLCTPSLWRALPDPPNGDE